MQSNLEVIRAHYNASKRGDLEGMMAAITPETRWTEMAGFPYSGLYTGQAEINDLFRRVGKDWEKLSFDLERLLDVGTWVVAVGTYSGKVRKTGKSTAARVVHLWQLENGSITSFEQFTDTLLFSKALN